jgi:hypothetical protein
MNLRGALRLVTGLLLLPSAASAHQNGFPNPGCDGCHSRDAFDGEVSLEAMADLVPERATTFRLTIRESQMVAAGFYVHVEDEVGALGAVDGAARTTSDNDLVQARPTPATNGTASIDFSWAPPAQPGGTNFLVYVVSADDDGTNKGDRTTAASFTFTWGCDPITLYRDIDGDGFGVDTETRPDCNAREGWALEPGDCNDLWATIHPGAPETGNSKDDDCDGEVDEGIDLSIVYPDQDGDGYGDVLADPVSAQAGLEGYVANATDCNDADASVHPDAEEICDGIDNDCDYERDEGTSQTCGVGRCARRMDTCEQQCVPGTPEPETCNGLDDDCNGVTDDGVECPAGQVCGAFSCIPAEDAAATTPDAGSTEPAATEVTNTAASAPPESSTESESSTAAEAPASEAPGVEAAGANGFPQADRSDTEDTGAADESTGCSVSRRDLPVPGPGLTWALLGLAGVARRRRAAA